MLLPFKVKNHQPRRHAYIRMVSCGQSAPKSHKVCPVLQCHTSATLQIAIVILPSNENIGEKTGKCRPTYFILIMATGTKLYQKHTESGFILA